MTHPFKIFLLCFILLSLFFLAACNNSGETTTDDNLQATIDNLAAITSELATTAAGEASNVTLTQPVGTAPPELATATATAAAAATDPPTVTPAPVTTPTLSPTPAALEGDFPQVNITLSSTNLRSGPDTCHERLLYLREGDTVLLLATNDDRSWYNVQTENGLTGWIASTVAEPVGDIDLAEIPKAVSIPACPTSATTPAAGDGTSSSPTPTATPTIWLTLTPPP